MEIERHVCPSRSSRATETGRMSQYGLLKNGREVLFLMEILGLMIPCRGYHYTTIHNSGIGFHARSIFLASRKVGHNHHRDEIYMNMVEGLKRGVV